jgi:hypothetical protein
MKATADSLNAPLGLYRHWRSWLIILGICAVYLTLTLALNPAPEPPLLQRGLSAWLIEFEEPSTLAQGLWPSGYPLLLEGISNLTGDTLLAARMVAIASLGLLLAGVYHIIEALTGRRGLARSCLPFVALFAPLAGDALLASPGLPYAALAVWAIYAASTARRRKLGLFAAGVFSGAAYLFRYQALALLIFGLLAALRLRKNQLGEFGLFIGGWLLGALPQLILTTIAHGNPFHQLSFRILGWEIFQDAQSADRYTLWWLASKHPLKLFGHWLGGIGRTAWQTLWPLGALGWWGLWRNRGRLDELDENQLAITALGGGVLALAAGFSPQTAGLNEGALAALGPALAVAAAGIWFRDRSWAIPYLALMIMLLRLSYPEVHRRVEEGVTVRRNAAAVFRMAEEAGVDAAEGVASATWQIYDPDDGRLVPALSPAGMLGLDPTLSYARPWAPTDPAELISFARATGSRLVVMTADQAPPKLRPGLRLLGRSGGLSVFELLAPGGNPLAETPPLEADDAIAP